jgi:phasin family protein
MSSEKPFNPFANFDFGKFDISKMLGDLKMPGMNLGALMDAQRKNLEALTAANKVAVDGMQAIAKRQAEIMAQALAEVTNITQQLTSATNPQEASVKQAELIKQAFEKSLANMRELAEMINKANTEAFEVINRRFSESLEELRNLMPKQS